MISSREISENAAAFGVPAAQVVRDHLISHVIFALSEIQEHGVVFFGGTALCRTWCADSRLSEDIDLLVDDYVQASIKVPEHVTRVIRRDFPSAAWSDSGRRHEVDTKVLQGSSGTSVNVQFVAWRTGWRALPVTPADVRLRYSDLPETARLNVPTPEAFVAMKLMSWADRKAPRDLFDLYELARLGHFTQEVPRFVKAITGVTPTRRMFEGRVPKRVREVWGAELGHQRSDLPEPDDCFEIIHAAFDLAEQR